MAAYIKIFLYLICIFYAHNFVLPMAFLPVYDIDFI